VRDLSAVLDGEEFIEESIFEVGWLEQVRQVCSCSGRE
jgi:hypothetical protein